MIVAESCGLKFPDKARRANSMKSFQSDSFVVPLEVLLVDDDELFLDITAFELGQLGCSVTAASDPEDALRILRERDFDAVITDWQMPVIDGIELVRRAREDIGPDRFRYVVLTTARAEASTARAALEAGADDVLFKPLDRLQLELAVASVRRTVTLQRRLQRHNRHLTTAHRKTREAYRRIEADVAAAAALHRGLLPRAQPADRVDFAWSYMPASNLGGDSIGLVTLRSGATLFFVVDVRGHGVPAALASFHVHHRLIQLSPESGEDLTMAIGQLNDEMVGQPGDTYCTLLCGVISPDGKTAEIVRAGHPQPILLGGEAAITLDIDGSFPLGWFSGTDFAAQTVALPTGGCIAIYSDGVTDCTDEAGLSLGPEGLEALLAEAPVDDLSGLITKVEARMHTLRGRREFEDDVSLLLIRSRQNGSIST